MDQKTIIFYKLTCNVYRKPSSYKKAFFCKKNRKNTLKTEN